jgi:lipid A 3-O-deacylase
MRSRYLLVLLFVLFISTESSALDGISLGIGKSRDSINIYHLGFQKQFGHSWLKSEVGSLSGYHELSLNYWEHSDESIQQVAYSPVFAYESTAFGSGIFPYLEGGIGVSYISEKMIKGRNMSSHFQFEDRIGMGVRVGEDRKHDLNFGYLHYSNAGIKQPNDGIDIFILSYTYSF